MNVERFQRVKAIFLSACERSDDDRSQFLEEACGDDTELRTAVERLLVHDGAPMRMLSPNRFRSHLQRMAGMEMEVEVDSEAAPSPAGRPRQIGRYRILDSLGEGGMGMVYLAEQENPKRTVALKVIAPGRLSRQTLRRFEHEASVLGRLRHPGIAQIYEAGMFETGLGDQPYFAMELVQGRTLLVFAKEERLSIRQRIELMASVCEGVEHAHQRGVIHRDLKPGNILMDEQEPGGQPKILDFGVARAIDDDDQAQDTMHTASGQFVGTVAYMSPEQAAGDAGSVDVRSDVYALGVVLYQLLTGAFPYRVDGSVREAMDAIINAVPRRPRQVNRAIDDETETIILKSLDKLPARRYQSAGELGRDLRRYLAGQAIEAKRDSVAYLIGTQIRRHKLAVVVAAGFVIVVTAGMIVSTTFWRQAVRDRISAEEAQHAQALQTQRADANAAQANTALDMVERMFGPPTGAMTRSPDLTVQKLLDDFDAGLGSDLQDQPGVETSIRRTLGVAYLRMGRFAKARPQLESALALSTRLEGRESLRASQNMSALGICLLEMGELDAAESMLKEAVDIQARLLEPGDVRRAPTLHNWASLMQTKGDMAGAEKVLRQSLEILNSTPRPDDTDIAVTQMALGAVLNSVDRTEEAEPLLRNSLATLRNAHGDNHEDVALAINNIGILLSDRHDYPGAEKQFREAIEVWKNSGAEGNPDFGMTVRNLGWVLNAQGHPAAAAPLYEQALGCLREAYGDEHPHIAMCLADQASLFLSEGKHAEAEQCLRKAVEINRHMLGNTHEETGLRLSELGRLLYLAGRHEEAEAVYREVLSIDRKHWPADSPRLAVSCVNVAFQLQALDRMDEAVPLFEEALRLWRTQPGERPRGFVETLSALATYWAKHNDFARAEALDREMLEVYRATLPPRDPAILGALTAHAFVLLKLERVADAEAQLRECVAFPNDGSYPAWQWYYAEGLLGNARVRQGDATEGAALLDDAFAAMNPDPDAPPFMVAQLRGALVNACEVLGQKERAAHYRAIQPGEPVR